MAKSWLVISSLVRPTCGGYSTAEDKDTVVGTDWHVVNRNHQRWILHCGLTRNLWQKSCRGPGWSVQKVSGYSDQAQRNAALRQREKTNQDFSCFWLDLTHRQNGHKVAVLVARVSEEDLAYRFKIHENKHKCEIHYLRIVGAVESGEDVPVCGWGLWLCHLHMTM